MKEEIKKLRRFKILLKYFDEIANGNKRAEIRRYTPDLKIGEKIILYTPLTDIKFTYVVVEVTNIIHTRDMTFYEREIRGDLTIWSFKIKDLI